TETYTNTTTSIGTGISEVQTLTVTGAVGTYRLVFQGQQTNPIAQNALASQVQAELNLLPGIINGGGGFVPLNQTGHLYPITFGGTLTGFNQAQLTTTGSTGPVVTVNTLMDGDGTALELERGAAVYNGGVMAGLEVWNERLVLKGTGNALFGDTPLTALS